MIEITWPVNQLHFHISLIFVEMNFYSLSFLYDNFNEVDDQVNYEEIIIKMIISLQTYVLNIPIRGIFMKDIKLSEKNKTIQSESYDEYD